jgi:hypothetical protein
MTIEQRRLAGTPALQPQAIPPAPAVQTKAASPADAMATPSLEMSGSFENNIFPSLLLSFGAAYPEYSRGLRIALRNLPAQGVLQLRVDSGLFVRPVLEAFEGADGAATLSPELPWNFAALRRTSQMQPQTFVATLLVDGRPEGETTLVCTLHSVNEAVSRIYNTATGQWLDTSVCFAAFVNEDHPWINALLQEAAAGGTVHSFTGYQSSTPGVMLQAQAIWDALASRGLSYVNVATDSSPSPLVSTQYVRFLDQSVRDHGANCVDASVLFASILRKIGLRPVLLFRPGHCFTGFYDAPEGGRLIAFETTYLGAAPFSAAEAEGAKELQTTLPYLGTPQYSIVDIAVCRGQGISPISYDPTDRD